MVTVNAVNDPPTVVSAMADTTVAEDNAPINDYRDLNDVFSDIEDGSALDFVVQSNSNATLVTPVIDAADSTLDFTFGANENGTATIVIRATDSGPLSVDDTLVVTVNAVNDPPTVASAMADTTVAEDNAPINDYRDLNDVFSDVEDGSALDFVVQSNSNPTLVTPTIDGADSTLDFTFGANENGTATIVIRATDSGPLSVDDTLVVTVNAANDPPTVASAMADTTVNEDNAPINDYRDLNDVFSDIEDGSALTFTIENNTNPALVTPVIEAVDSTLDVSFAANQSGSAAITIRATDSGSLFVEDMFVVTVTPDPTSNVTLVDSSGTSYPTSTFLGDPSLILKIGLNNLTATGVMLTTASSIVFSDSVSTYQAQLANLTYIPPNARNFTATFSSAPVSNSFAAPASYDFRLYLLGNDDSGLTYLDTLVTTGRNSIVINTENIDITNLSLIPAATHPGDADVELLSLSLENNTLQDVQLDTLTMLNTSAGPGNPSDLDNTFSVVRIYHDNGNGIVDGSDILIRDALSFSGGPLTATDLNFDILTGETKYLLITADIDSTCARDGDVLQIEITSANDIGFDQPFTAAGVFPLSTPTPRNIDGMMAFQLTVYPKADSVVVTEGFDLLMFDLGVPGNGYETDTLRTLKVENQGTATTEHFDRLALYVDGGDGNFDVGSGDDTYIGDFIEDLAKPGGRAFKIEGLAIPLGLACGNHTRFYVAADIGLDYTVGGSIQFSVPVIGVTVSSNNDGPIDVRVTDPSIQIIPQPDRLTTFPYSVGDKNVYPGASQNLNAGIGFFNGYANPLLLQKIRFFQVGTASSVELDSVHVYADTDGDGLFDPALDLRLSSLESAGASFVFDNLNLTLDAGKLSYVFLSYDLPLETTDSVTIDLQLFDTQGLVVEPLGIEIQGEFPINSPGLDRVDGMVAAQISLGTAPAFTAAPNDQDVLAATLTIPPNGLWTDVLNTVSISNAGTALAGVDIASVRLWKESGGSPIQFDPLADTPLGALTWNGATWSNTVPFNEPIALSGLRTYVTFSVFASPTDGATFQGRIPTDGIQVASGNDGPIDQAIINPAVQEISTDPLITSLSADRMTYSVGQSITLSMRVRNESVDTLLVVTPSPITSSGSGVAVMTSGPNPGSFDLTPGEDSTFVWLYVAQTAGDIEFCGFAQTADSLIASQSSCTATLVMQNRAGTIPLALVNGAPATVNRGQWDVAAFGLMVDYQSGDSSSVPLDFEGIKVFIEDASGTPLPPNQILKNVILTDPGGEHFIYSVIDSFVNPLYLTLQSPIVVQPGTSVSVGTRFDISDSAALTQFRMRVDAIDDIFIFDGNDGTLVSRTSPNTFPWLTTTIAINTPAESLLVGSDSGADIFANIGQEDLAVFSIDFLSPGLPSTAREILESLTFGFVDTAGAPIVPNSVVKKITLSSGTQLLATDDIIPPTGSTMTINLTTPLVLAPGNTETVDVQVDLKSIPQTDGFGMRISSPAAIVARDINNDRLVTVSAADPATSDFPFVSDRVIFQPAASGVLAQFVDRMPASMTPATTSVPIMDIVLGHQDTTTASSLRVDSLSLEFRTPSGSPLYPGDYFSSLVITHGPDTVSVVTSLSSISSLAECRFSTPVFIDPATSESLSVFVSVKSVFAPTDLEVRLEQQHLVVFDANDGNRLFGIAGTFPFVAGPGNLVLPSERVLVDLISRLPGNVSTRQIGVDALDLRVQNGSTPGLTPIALRTVRVEMENAQGSQVNPNTLLAAANLITSDSTIVPGVLNATEMVFTLPDSLVIVPSGATDTLALTISTQTTLADINFRFAIRDSTSVQAIDAVSGSAIATGTISGLGFPLLTNFAHILGTSSEGAFTNYPNPFAAGREGTRITYYLDQNSRVSLKLYTLWGAPVITLVDNRSMNPGLHQTVVWDGRNGEGDIVNNGVYYLVLDIQRANGNHEVLKRKVGVIR
ncbi:MAG: Ig-like domain-containing protein [Candidatus Krumholzibacteria bacterium]|nr:Ig-like domain-containing protein [Candidatus Krumholzibacteria bacterium]